MTEPTNPLFEDEKDFLERKKLEYERALRGDVQVIKEQTVQAGKVALVGAGVVSGVWLLAKAFGGRKPKKKHKKHRPAFEDYAGFNGFDENDQEVSELANGFQDTGYAYDQDENYNSWDSDDGFYSNGSLDEDDLDDNGLSHNPEFPAHSAPTHGFEADAGAQYEREEYDQEEGAVASTFAADSLDAHPYDDSRRLAHSTEFEEPAAEQDFFSAKPKSSKLSFVGPALVAFAKSETGRVVVAQAAAVALAMVTKAVQDIMPKHADETGKNADLAASSAPEGVQPLTWPATSAAQNVSAAAYHDDTLTSREPLA